MGINIVEASEPNEKDSNPQNGGSQGESNSSQSQPVPIGTEELDINSLNLEPALDARCKPVPVSILEYAELMEEGRIFSPVSVFQDGIDGKYFLADGYHRVKAAEKIGRLKIKANIFRGNKDAAFRFGVFVNSTKGLPMKKEDIKKNVLSTAVPTFSR